jgi:hypothetical protein
MRHAARALAAAIALTAAASPAADAAELLRNGDFETRDFTGWDVQSLNTDVCGGSYCGLDGLYARSGEAFAYMGNPYCCGYIFQEVRAAPNQWLTLTYWRMSDGARPNFFEAMWNGQAVPGSTIFNAGDERRSGYVKYSFQVWAQDSNLLAFRGQNKFGFDVLDDISVTGVSAVPEPAAWASLLLGFGALGAALRRRRPMAFLAP